MSFFFPSYRRRRVIEISRILPFQDYIISNRDVGKIYRSRPSQDRYNSDTHAHCVGVCKFAEGTNNEISVYYQFPPSQMFDIGVINPPLTDIRIDSREKRDEYIAAFQGISPSVDNNRLAGESGEIEKEGERSDTHDRVWMSGMRQGEAVPRYIDARRLVWVAQTNRPLITETASDSPSNIPHLRRRHRVFRACVHRLLLSPLDLRPLSRRLFRSLD